MQLSAQCKWKIFQEIISELTEFWSIYVFAMTFTITMTIDIENERNPHRSLIAFLEWRLIRISYKSWVKSGVGRGVGLPKLDILFWVGPPKSDIIGYGRVGRSKKGPNNRISFMDGPFVHLKKGIFFQSLVGVAQLGLPPPFEIQNWSGRGRLIFWTTSMKLWKITYFLKIFKRY